MQSRRDLFKNLAKTAAGIGVLSRMRFEAVDSTPEAVADTMPMTMADAIAGARVPGGIVYCSPPPDEWLRYNPELLCANSPRRVIP